MNTTTMQDAREQGLTSCWLLCCMNTSLHTKAGAHVDMTIFIANILIAEAECMNLVERALFTQRLHCNSLGTAFASKTKS